MDNQETAVVRSKRGFRFLGVLALVGLCVGVAWVGWIPRRERAARLAAQDARRREPPRVLITRVEPAEETITVVLPGDTRAADVIQLTARADGYVREVKVDIGAVVREGELLATLEAPERDLEIRAAEARATEAERRLSLTAETTARTSSLTERGVATGQERDDAELGLTTASSLARASRAELRRLEVLRQYQRVVAPFDGIVTMRGPDPGSLVTAGSTVMFELQRPQMEVAVDVPQAYATAITRGAEADVLDGERVVARGVVARTASSLRGSTRAMRAELEVSANEPLISGMYVRVRFELPRLRPATKVPGRALVVDGAGTSVWTLDENDRVHRVPVRIERDLGRELELSTGPASGTRIVLSPPDAIREDLEVHPVQPGSGSGARP